MIRASTIVLFLMVFIFLAVNLFIPDEDYRSPSRFGSYPISGMYTYNPETIFVSLEQGDTNVFLPYFGNPDAIERYYDPITWSQANYLKIVNALSQIIWDESLDSNKWSVVSVYFAQSCTDNPKGFNRFNIVYYEDLGVKNWKRHYTTRLVDIEPWRGLVYWGSGAIFTSTVLSQWESIELDDFLISADDALQMAEESGGNETDKSHCSTIAVSMFQRDDEKWDVTYFAADFGMYIDANSGKYEVLK